MLGTEVPLHAFCHQWVLPECSLRMDFSLQRFWLGLDIYFPGVGTTDIDKYREELSKVVFSPKSVDDCRGHCWQVPCLTCLDLFSGGAKS